MNVLIVKPSSLGDVVHTLPAVHMLRQCVPEARLVWVVNREYADLVRLSPDVDAVLVFDRQRLRCVRHWGELAAFGRELRAERFDLALDFQGLLRSGLMAFFSRAARRVGFAEAREGARFLYHSLVKVQADLTHAVDRNAALVRAVFPSATDPIMFPVLRQDRQGVERAMGFLAECGVEPAAPLVAVAPAARWDSKQWPAAFFAEVMEDVAAQRPGTVFWLVGTAAEREIGDRVAGSCRRARVVNAMGRTDLVALVELLRRSRVLLANDSGPMHLAVAVQCSVVALFGPTAARLTGPYGDGHTVLTGQCPVSPCFDDRCRFGQRQCVTSVPAAAAAKELLARLG